MLLRLLALVPSSPYSVDISLLLSSNSPPPSPTLQDSLIPRIVPSVPPCVCLWGGGGGERGIQYYNYVIIIIVEIVMSTIC